jgi:hypothetical protein
MQKGIGGCNAIEGAVLCGRWFVVCGCAMVYGIYFWGFVSKLKLKMSLVQRSAAAAELRRAVRWRSEQNGDRFLLFIFQ